MNGKLVVGHVAELVVELREKKLNINDKTVTYTSDSMFLLKLMDFSERKPLARRGAKGNLPTWAPYTPKRHTRPYFGCAERAYVQNAQNFHSWGVLGMRLPCVVFIQVHRQANAQLLTHIFITQVLHIQRMLGVLTEAFRVHPRATLHLPIVNSRDLTWRYFLQQQYQ